MLVSPESRPHDEAWKGYLLAAVAAAFWATGGIVAKWLFSPLDATSVAWPVPPPGLEVDAVTLSGARALIASLICFAYLAVGRRAALKVTGRDLVFLAVFGIGALAAVHVTYFKAISYTNVATAILLEYLAPVLVFAFSVAFLGERFSIALPSGVALSILGCALVVGAFGPEGLVVSPQGIAWGLAAAAFFALYQLLGKFAAPRFSPWTLLAYGLGFAALFWLAYLGGPRSIVELMSTPEGFGAVIYVAVFSTIVPFGASLKALHYIDATKAVVTSTLEPVIAGAVAWFALGESFDALQLLGGVLVLAAIIVVQQPDRRRLPLPPGT